MTKNATIITNVSSPISEASAHACAKAGRPLVLCDPDENAGSSLASILSEKYEDIIFVHGDVSDKLHMHNVIAEAAESFGAIGALIHNAVQHTDEPSFIDFAPEDLFDLLKDQLFGAFVACQAITKFFLRKQEENAEPDGQLSIVNLTSSSAGRLGKLGAAAIQGGIVELTHAIAVSNAEYGVTANTIGVGHYVGGVQSDIELKTHRNANASTRLGEPNEIAALAEFLTSSEARYINGQHIVVDGGGVSLRRMLNNGEAKSK